MSNKEVHSDIVIGGRSRRRRRARLALLAVLGVVFLGGSTAVSYYVDALWFDSLGYASVFWTRLSLQSATFGAFALLTFLVVYGEMCIRDRYETALNVWESRIDVVNKCDNA